MVMVLRHDRARSGLELLGHCPHLGEQLGHAAGDVVDPGQELGTYASVWHRNLASGVPGAGRVDRCGPYL
jgi:hypothetical protein